MSKKDFNTANEVEVTEVANEVNEVEVTSTDNVLQEATVERAEVDTPEVVDEVTAKARTIISARLPELIEKGLNFEKRTGNFFKATLEKDENGEEKPRRRVVNIDNADEPDFLALDEATLKEVNLKRCAAFVEYAEKTESKIDADIAEKQAQLDELLKRKASFKDDLNKAKQVVIDAKLPERTAAVRATLSAKVDSLASENEKLRQMLIAAGLELPENLK